MRQSIPRRVTGASGQDPARQRALFRDPLSSGWPVFAPPASHRNHMTRGAWQANEVAGGVVAGAGLGSDSPYEAIATTGVVTAGTIASGSAAVTAALGSLAIPVIGAVVAGVVLAIALLFNRKGPKQKIATTEIVNKVEPELQKNLAGYMAGPRTKSSQAQALENFKAGWQYVVDNCDVPVMGNPGKECVSDRQRGGEWDWFSYYYDPIANDSGVIADPPVGSTVIRAADGTVTVTPPTGALDQLTTDTGIPAPLLLGGLALVAMMMMGGKR